MTKVDADALMIVEKLAEAMALGIPAEVAPLAQSPTAILPEEHPEPWTSQGRPVPRHHQEDPDGSTDDARGGHVVRGARGDVVIECAELSKVAEESVARLIVSVGKRRAEIERLQAALIETLEVNRFKILTEVDRLRTDIAEVEATFAKLSDALKAAAPRTPATQQAEGGEEPRRRPMPWDYREEPDVEGGAS
jgi:hypothetical protein